VLNNEHPQDIARANLDFIDKIGLKEHLSPTRSNGLNGMIRKIKMESIKNIHG
jgi:cysteine desulfuration protein SufE